MKEESQRNTTPPPSHGAFYEIRKPFSIHTIYNRSWLPHQRLKGIFRFCRLIERDKHKARRFLYSSMLFFILHVQCFVSMEPNIMRRLEDLFNCETR
jgi:hypothetical protein